MPKFAGIPITIPSAWRQGGEVNRIHYILRVGSRERRLYADGPGGLYAQLDAQLTAMGYNGPASARPLASASALPAASA